MARLLTPDAAAAVLDVEVAPGTTILSGTPTARYRELAAGDPSPVGEVGVWEMTTGSVADIETDEVFVVLSGSAELHVAGGDGADETIALRPGAVVRLRTGDRTEWRVTEPLRKVYVQAQAG